MDELERKALGEKVKRVRNARYAGSKKAAYTAAGVNAATWDRVEQGLSVKERSLVAIVTALWPETEGDWTRIDLFWPRTKAIAAEEAKSPDIDWAQAVKGQPATQGDLDDLRTRLGALEEQMSHLAAVSLAAYAQLEATAETVPANVQHIRNKIAHSQTVDVEDVRPLREWIDEHLGPAAYDEEHTIGSEQGHDETP